MDGIAAARAIAERHPDTAVIVMSADGLDEALLEGTGAIGSCESSTCRRGAYAISGPTAA